MEQPKTHLLKTILNATHLQLGAKMVDFCGWQMPLKYSEIRQEHLAVRNAVGIFDVSHMGRIVVSGNDAGPFLNYLSTNEVANKPNLTATYTVFCHSDGGSVDDVIVYKVNEKEYFIIVNACNREKDLLHLKRYAANVDVHIEDRFNQEGIVSVQGPIAAKLINEIFLDADQLSFMHFKKVDYLTEGAFLSRSGYTGEDGFELYGTHAQINSFWNQCMHIGQKYGLLPCGLASRDTLRLEMGYALYGHELTDQIAPNESVAAWTVKQEKKDFLGKSSLQASKRHEYAIVIEEGIPREGYVVYKEEKKIGTVTSGTFSPTLNIGIALILVEIPLSIGETVFVKIRDRLGKATVTKLPFVK